MIDMPTSSGPCRCTGSWRIVLRRSHLDIHLPPQVGLGLAADHSPPAVRRGHDRLANAAADHHGGARASHSGALGRAGVRLAEPAAEALRNYQLDPEAVSGELAHWLQTNFLKTELEHCLRLPQEGPRECALVLRCSNSVTTSGYAPGYAPVSPSSSSSSKTPAAVVGPARSSATRRPAVGSSSCCLLYTSDAADE